MLVGARHSPRPSGSLPYIPSPAIPCSAPRHVGNASPLQKTPRTKTGSLGFDYQVNYNTATALSTLSPRRTRNHHPSCKETLPAAVSRGAGLCVHAVSDAQAGVRGSNRSRRGGWRHDQGTDRWPVTHGAVHRGQHDRDLESQLWQRSIRPRGSRQERGARRRQSRRAREGRLRDRPVRAAPGAYTLCRLIQSRWGKAPARGKVCGPRQRSSNRWTHLCSLPSVIDDVEMWIVEREPPPEVTQLQGDGAHITGWVGDVVPYCR